MASVMLGLRQLFRVTITTNAVGEYDVPDRLARLAVRRRHLAIGQAGLQVLDDCGREGTSGLRTLAGSPIGIRLRPRDTMLPGQASDVELGEAVAGGHGLVEHAGPHIPEDGQGPRRDGPGVRDRFGRRWLGSFGQRCRQGNVGPLPDVVDPLPGDPVRPGYLVRLPARSQIAEDRQRAG